MTKQTNAHDRNVERHWFDVTPTARLRLDRETLPKAPHRGTWRFLRARITCNLRDNACTVAAVGLSANQALRAQEYEGGNTLPAEYDAKLRLIHASLDVATVDIGPENSDDLFTPWLSRYLSSA